MSGRFLAEFELYVMLAVARLGEKAYGAAIRREIQRRTGRPVSIGALYATLARLGEKGLLTFQVSDPRPVQGGRARKYCHLTGEGREALEHSATMLHRMMEGVDLTPAPDGGA
jgi:DNA-binding PadR family transcriptional regulator